MNVLYSIWVAARKTGSLIDDALEPAGMTASEFALYSAIRRDGPLTTTQLAESTGAPMASVSRSVKRIEDAGDAERRRHPDDGRAALIALTTQGEARWHQAARFFRTVLEPISDYLGEFESSVMWAFETFDRALDHVAGSPATRPPDTPPGIELVEGKGLSADQFTEVRRFADWLAWRDEA